MRILFLTKRYYTNQDLIEDRFGRLFHLPKALADLGHRVAVVAVDYRSGESEMHEIDGVAFHSIALRGVDATQAWRWIRSIASEIAPDVVVGSADTHIGWMASRVARRTESMFVFDLYDNYLSFASARVPGMKRLYDRVVSEADLVLAVSDPLIEVAEAHGTPAAKIVNGVDRDLFRPIPRDTAREELGLDPESEVVGYVGSIEPDRGIESLVSAVAQLRSEGREIGLLMAGIVRLDIDFATSEIDYRGVVGQDKVPSLINACNVVVLPYLPTEWGRYTYPNKLAEYVACAVPIVATELPEFVSTLGADYAGLCAPGDEKAMATALRTQLTDPVHPDPASAISWLDLARSMVSALSIGG